MTVQAHTDLRGTPRPRAFVDSQLSTTYWNMLDKTAKKHFGIDTGAAYMRALRRAEHDFPFWAETFLGIPPFEWQTWVWDQFKHKPYGAVMLGNSGGKTVSFVMYYLTAGHWRTWSPEWWGLYRMLHHAPQEVQALEVHMQIKQLLAGQHRAQRKWVPARAGKKGGHKGSWEYRPCLIWPFVQEAMHDNGKHHGFDFFGGSSTLTFRSTAYKAKASDGVDPYFIGEDELRHELHLTHIVENIFMPRFLRVPKGHLYLPFTPLEASPEAVEYYNRGATGTDPDWFGFNEDLRVANPGLQEEDIQRLERNTEKRLHKQIVSGRPTQPALARFNQSAVEEAFVGTKAPDDLDELKGLRARVTGRCPSCKSQRAGDTAYKAHNHLMVGALDPASSSDSADDIVFTVWDLEPYWDGRLEKDKATPICVYIKQAEAGTPECLIQNVAKHLAAIADEIKGPCAYDLNSALGHNVQDLLIDFEGEFIGIDKHTRDDKLKAVDFLSGLVDRGLWRSYFHQRTKAQMLAWMPNDKRIRQDHLMVQVVAAEVAKPDLPDFVTDPDTARELEDAQRTASAYDGFGGDGAWGPVAAEDAPMSGLDPMTMVPR